MYEDIDELIPQSTINEEKIKKKHNIFANFFVSIFMKIDRKAFINLQLEKLQHMTLIGIINDPIAKKLFAKYIQLGHRCDSESTTHLKCYYLCNKILENSKLLSEINILENLIELCPSYAWEQKIRKNLTQQKESQTKDIKSMLTFLKRESIIELECHQDYHRFISDKLKIQNH